MMNEQTTMADDQKARQKAYKKTLNLPKTAFPMKANLVQNEPASQKRWEKADLYGRVQNDEARSETFVFHDGPPYANATLHLGHFLNKTLKDFVVRTKLMEGYRVPFVPGWDCHGLPIEHKVLQELAEKGKLDKLRELEESKRRTAIRSECGKYAAAAVKRHTGQLKRMLTLADYDDPYLTMNPAYEGAVLDVFAGLVEKGLVYRQLKAVHWSVANETALADAELEYYDREDVSVYVDFEAEDGEAVYRAFGLGEDDAPTQTPTFMIWTTTPWTLPANLAIAVNEEFRYALVRLNGNVCVLAEELVGAVAKLEDVTDAEVLATCGGGELVGLRYRHPFVSPRPDFSDQPDAAMRGSDADGVYRVVAADYVTLEDGTGLVHTAPGHGSEDYLTGLREKLPVYCPVRGDGTYDSSVPEKYRGLSVWEANETITDDLRASGHLYHGHRFNHSYPHDWRGKTPVIFRATEQWFVAVDEGKRDDGKTLRELAFDATDAAKEGSVRFIPEWGRNRMRGMLENRPDWCISRQRSWGLPIPAFYTADGETLLTTASVRAVAKAFREEGSDSWFVKDAVHLLRHYDAASDAELPESLRGVDVAALTKSQDIFDVWFESGSSWNAVMRERMGDAGFPVDLYLEGSDQHRGWFQLSLLPSLGVMGRPAFRSVLTHGFMVDKEGKKMSKSVGNTLDVDELLEEFGADVCRWFLGSISYETDVRSDRSSFETAGEAYRKVRNTLRFMLSNLSDFDAQRHLGDGGASEGGEGVKLPAFPAHSVDAWVLSEFVSMAEAVRGAYGRYEFQKATSRLYSFCNETLSATYLAAVKDRLYCDLEDSERRRRTQTALWVLTDGLSRLLAPVLPHTADEAWRELHGFGKDDQTSVHEKRFVSHLRIEAAPEWASLMRTRDEVLRAIERKRAEGEVDAPLDLGVVLPDSAGAFGAFDVEDLADLCGVSRFELSADAAEIGVFDLRGEPACERSWKRHATVKERSDGGMLSDRDAEAVGVA